MKFHSLASLENLLYFVFYYYWETTGNRKKYCFMLIHNKLPSMTQSIFGDLTMALIGYLKVICHNHKPSTRFCQLSTLAYVRYCHKYFAMLFGQAQEAL